MRTQGSFYADTPHAGGVFWYGASNVNWDGVGTLLYTRNGAGDYSLNTSTAATTYHITASLADLKRLLEYSAGSSGVAPTVRAYQGLPYQEEFGAGTPGTFPLDPSDSSGGAPPAQPGWPSGAPGLPPFSGTNQLTVPTADKIKGIRINSVSVVYLVTATALTTHTINLYRTTYANNVANSVATLTLSSNSLSTATQANPYFSTVTVTGPVFEPTASTSDLIAEVLVTTGTTSTYRFYGIGFLCDFNFD